MGGLSDWCSLGRQDLIINLCIWAYNSTRYQFNLFRAKKDFRERIKTLDPKEQAVIREFFLSQQTSIDMPIDDPIIVGLIDFGILKINKQFGNSSIMKGRRMSVSLGKYPEKILDLSNINLKKKPTEEEVEFIQKNRPWWVGRFDERY